MVKEIRIYIEGGGKGRNKATTVTFNKGFNAFLWELRKQARAKNIRWSLISCGSTDETYRDFERSVKSNKESFNVLVVDADEAVADDETAREFLQKKHKKWKLKNIDDEQCHLMVQIMEAWFIADIDALKNYYGQGFNQNAIPKTINVEAIDKASVEIGLKNATRNTQKREYHKINHGCELLERVDSSKVRQAARHCENLFEVIRKKIG